MIPRSRCYRGMLTAPPTEGKVTIGGAYAVDVCPAKCRGMFFCYLQSEYRADRLLQILEPMSSSSAQVRNREEVAK